MQYYILLPFNSYTTCTVNIECNININIIYTSIVGKLLIYIHSNYYYYYTIFTLPTALLLGAEMTTAVSDHSCQFPQPGLGF